MVFAGSKYHKIKLFGEFIRLGRAVTNTVPLGRPRPLRASYVQYAVFCRTLRTTVGFTKQFRLSENWEKEEIKIISSPPISPQSYPPPIGPLPWQR
jgi:hypothetical protein